MIEATNPPKRKRSVRGIVVFFVVSILLAGAFFLYTNFSRLVSEALMKSFNSGIASEVYELTFENLSVNPFAGTIQVYNVTMQPREVPLREYSYINSSFQLSTEKVTLRNVEILTLLRSKQLKLKIISITKPDVRLMLRGKRSILLPFKDSTSVASKDSISKKKIVDSFMLNAFHLIEAEVHVTNEVKQQEFKISNFSISLNNLLIDAQPGEYSSSFDRVLLTIGQLTGKMRKGPIQFLEFKAFNIGIDSLKLRSTLDTVMYTFHDFTTGLHKLDIQTADSLFHLKTESLKISYQEKWIRLKSISFIPNVSYAVLQQDHKFQHTEFSGTVKTLEFKQMNFDSLIYSKKLLIGEVVLDSVAVSIFKDKTKPLNKNRFPLYLGQTVRKISRPFQINRLRATHVHLDNTELKPDSTLAKVSITRATADVKNITNLALNSTLTMEADAWLMDKVHFNTNLVFYYSKEQFDFEGSLQKFDLSGLTPLINAYTPVKIKKGIADEISFSGTAQKTSAAGMMKFLYHDLDVDLELKNRARWVNSVIAFAANTVLASGNPGSANLPPRVVKFQIERDMNKGFVNVVIKSLLNGLKETMIMSKENKKAYKESKKKSKRSK